MKLNISFLVLFLIIFIKSQSLLDNFSIEGFKENMKKEGIFQTIQSIQFYYGLEVAIFIIYIVKALQSYGMFTKINLLYYSEIFEIFLIFL